jgi:type II secretory pathway pseudopilin PulG
MQSREAGFTYVIAMFMVAVLTLVSLRAVQVTMMNEKREKEAQLMAVGLAYQKAIRSYYEDSPGTLKAYPKSLEDMLLDARTTTTRRHLRKLYRDPMTGEATWGLIAAPDGGVMGVYSLSGRQPVKVAAFPKEMQVVNNPTKYQDWRFIYLPN